MSCKKRHGCNLQVVHIKGHNSCKTARGGTPTVRTPVYKLTVTHQGGGVDDDKPIDISAK